MLVILLKLTFAPETGVAYRCGRIAEHAIAVEVFDDVVLNIHHRVRAAGVLVVGADAIVDACTVST